MLGAARCGIGAIGAATFGTAKRGAMYGVGAAKWAAGVTTGRCASASVMKAGRMKASALIAIGRTTTNPNRVREEPIRQSGTYR